MFLNIYVTINNASKAIEIRISLPLRKFYQAPKGVIHIKINNVQQSGHTRERMLNFRPSKPFVRVQNSFHITNLKVTGNDQLTKY